jgi:putative transposase
MPYKGYRYPVEIISHCVWLYHRFPLNVCHGRSIVYHPIVCAGIVVIQRTLVA